MNEEQYAKISDTQTINQITYARATATSPGLPASLRTGCRRGQVGCRHSDWKAYNSTNKDIQTFNTQSPFNNVRLPYLEPTWYLVPIRIIFHLSFHISGNIALQNVGCVFPPSLSSITFSSANNKARVQSGALMAPLLCGGFYVYPCTHFRRRSVVVVIQTPHSNVIAVVTSSALVSLCAGPLRSVFRCGMMSLRRAAKARRSRLSQ
jgi:hypothetical protein